MAKDSYTYAILRIWVGAGLRLYFRKIRLNGKSECLEKDSTKPVILFANHQNALLDAIVLAVCNKRQINFLARAAVFAKPCYARILRSLLMQPVYRPVDGVDVRKSNEPIFEACVARLSEGAVIGIFPEGNHDHPKRLRVLKKGAIRMAVGYGKPFCFQAIGIDYLQHMKPFTDLEISISNPLEIKFDESDSDEHWMLEQCRLMISNAMLDIQNEELRFLILNLERIAWSFEGKPFDVSTKKKLLLKLADNEGMTAVLKPVLNDYADVLLHNSLSDEDILRFKNKGIFHMYFHAHFSKISYFAHLPLILLSKFLEAKLIEDFVFTGTFRFLYWFMAVQFYWIGGYVILALLSNFLVASLVFGILLLSSIILRSRGGNPGPIFVSEAVLKRAVELRSAIAHNINF